MWKNFAKFAAAIDTSSINQPSTYTNEPNPTKWLITNGGDDDGDYGSINGIINEANETASITMMNQRIIDGLMESIDKNCAIINLQLENF